MGFICRARNAESDRELNLGRFAARIDIIVLKEMEEIDVSASSDQLAILKYLYRRLDSGDTRYCTIATIKKNTGIENSNHYLLALTDDLESAGLVITRQAYQMSGGRLFKSLPQGMMPLRAETFLLG